MPKLLDNPNERILLEAKTMLKENGYKNFSMRELAKNCEMGLGTLYNYYKNKDSIVSSIFSNHWERIINKTRAIIDNDLSLKEKIQFIHEQINEFLEFHMDIFIEISSTKKGTGTGNKNRIIAPMISILEEILRFHREKDNISYKISEDKLAYILLNNIVLIIMDKYITLDELLITLDLI